MSQSFCLNCTMPLNGGGIYHQACEFSTSSPEMTTAFFDSMLHDFFRLAYDFSYFEAAQSDYNSGYHLDAQIDGRIDLPSVLARGDALERLQQILQGTGASESTSDISEPASPTAVITEPAAPTPSATEPSDPKWGISEPSNPAASFTEPSPLPAEGLAAYFARRPEELDRVEGVRRNPVGEQSSSALCHSCLTPCMGDYHAACAPMDLVHPWSGDKRADEELGYKARCSNCFAPSIAVDGAYCSVGCAGKAQNPEWEEERFVNSNFVVTMPSVPDDSDRGNSTGALRDSRYFFRELLREFPDLFSPANRHRIKKRRNPRVDEQWLHFHPGHKRFKGGRLHHHHWDNGHLAVALPEALHNDPDFSRKLHPLTRIQDDE